MKKALLGLFLVCLASTAAAQEVGGLLGTLPNQSHVSHRHYFPPREASVSSNMIAARSASNLVYSGGPVIVSAKVVFIFWGPSFADAASPDHLYAQSLIAFRNQFGTTPEYNTITQYYQIVGVTQTFIQLANLGSGTPDLFDSSTPPTNVTDADVQAKVNAYVTAHGNNVDTIYEVFIPSTSYSSDAPDHSSCGGPGPFYYCAYHGYFAGPGRAGHAVKYSIQPYPGCGFQVPGWTAAQIQEMFVCHETREAVTDEQFNAWYKDNNANEADDKCAWSPAPFLGTGGYGYQYEWSNAASACVKTR